MGYSLKNKQIYFSIQQTKNTWQAKRKEAPVRKIAHRVNFCLTLPCETGLIYKKEDCLWIFTRDVC